MADQGWKLQTSTSSRGRASLLPRTQFYQGPVQDEALSRLLFIIEQNRNCGLLFGPPGAGKSTLLTELTALVQRSGRPLAFVDAHGQNAEELLWDLSGGLGLSPRFAEPGLTTWRRIQDHITAHMGSSLRPIVVIDHADQGGEEVELLTSRLLHLAHQGRGLILFMAYRARHLSELPLPLREATDIRVELGWLDRNQTREFVREAFRTPGSREADAPDFTEAAIRRLYSISQGSPRLLTQVGDLAILSALANDEPLITENAIMNAATDLQIIDPLPSGVQMAGSGPVFYD